MNDMGSPHLTQAGPQIFQGAMQVHLERPLAASGRRRTASVKERPQDRMLDGFTLPQRQVGDRRTQPTSAMARRFGDARKRVPAGPAHEVDRAARRNDPQPG
jgi:hypothetical protein